MTQHAHHILAGGPLDRMDHLRPSIHGHLLAGPDPRNRFVLLADSGIVLRRADREWLLSEADLAEIPHERRQAVFLGGAGQEYYFALAVGAVPENTHEQADLRELAFLGRLPDAELGLLAQANSVVLWHAAHAFCGRCGAETAPAHGGWRRDCASCGAQHFPRVDPVVIMLVTCGELCLLGAGRNFRTPGMYACLAGFIEPGETIEDAARRELAEEAGIAGGRVDYMSSQPWPFPSSLMIGLRVEAESLEVTMDEKELVDLKWVPKGDVRAVLEGAVDRGFRLPAGKAIARTMLEAWVGSEE